MAQLDFSIDPNKQEQSFDPLPAGEYLVMIDGSELKPTKDKTGMILALKYQVLEGQYKGRTLFENLNIKNSNTQAQQIAQNALNEIGKIFGLAKIQDSAQLHSKPFRVKVKVKDDPTYGPKNEIKAHLSVEGKSASPSAPVAGTVPTQGSEAQFPWQQK